MTIEKMKFENKETEPFIQIEDRKYSLDDFNKAISLLFELNDLSLKQQKVLDIANSAHLNGKSIEQVVSEIWQEDMLDDEADRVVQLFINRAISDKEIHQGKRTSE